MSEPIAEEMLATWERRSEICRRNGMHSPVDAADTLRLIASHRDLSSQLARITEERDRLLYTSDKQTVAWKERALKAEARAASFAVIAETLAVALRRLHAAFKDIGAHEGPSPELTDWRFTAAEDTEACYAMEAASAALSSVSASQSSATPSPEPPLFVCNKCGYCGPTSEHAGCRYAATYAPNAPTLDAGKDRA